MRFPCNPYTVPCDECHAEKYARCADRKIFDPHPSRLLKAFRWWLSERSTVPRVVPQPEMYNVGRTKNPVTIKDFLNALETA